MKITNLAKFALALAALFTVPAIFAEEGPGTMVCGSTHTPISSFDLQVFPAPVGGKVGSLTLGVSVATIEADSPYLSIAGTIPTCTLTTFSPNLYGEVFTLTGVTFTSIGVGSTGGEAKGKIVLGFTGYTTSE